MPASEKTRGAHADDPEQTLCESDADVERPAENEAGAQSKSKGVATYREFADALIGIGLIDAASLERYAADSSEGVLGLSRALVKAGWITPYQAAAVYQNKSRGLLVGNYLILDKIGQGGMGMVFKARHRELGRLGALKILPPSFTRDRAAVTRFRREFEVAAGLKHINVVAAFEADEDRGVHFLVMDYVPGINLDQFVRQHGPLLLHEAVDYLIQSARGLEAAHERGIIHRDIKPGNLMLDCSGTVRVLDLGLARIIDASNPFTKSVEGRLTRSGTYMGSIDYMAPEQAEDAHTVDLRADIYSLGCTFFYLLTGRQPFAGQSMLKRLVAHQEHPAPSLRATRSDVSPALEAAYQKMMAKRPEDRPASMTEVIALVQASKHATANETANLAAPVGPRPAKRISHEAPREQVELPRTIVDSGIFARRAEAERTLSDCELNLRDLVMDVRSDVCIPDESDAAKDESVVVCDDRELNLRELAKELEEEAPAPAAPKPPAAPAQPLKRSTPQRQEESPAAAPKPPAARAQPSQPAAPLRQEEAKPAAPKPATSDALRLKPAGTLNHEEARPAVPKRPAAAARPLKPTELVRQQEPLPSAPEGSGRKFAPVEPVALPASGELSPNKTLAILGVVTAVLLVVAIALFLSRRPTTVGNDERSTPVQNSSESENPQDGALPPPV
jgi:serine/threonine protein kinase